MKITKVKLENFRGFESLEMTIHPRATVLIGANGGGKTTVLDAIVNALIFRLQHAQRKFLMEDRRLGTHSSSVKVWFGDVYVDSSVVNDSWADFHGSSEVFSAAQLENGPLPVAVNYQCRRSAVDNTPGSTNPERWPASRAWDPPAGVVNFGVFFSWFREREDLENEMRAEDPGRKDHQLECVRGAMKALMPGYSQPRVRRNFVGARSGRPVLTVKKGAEELAFDQLSEGERTMTALVSDIARRLAIANPMGNALEGKGVVLIDEVDLHLHPKWQADIVPSLLRTFPNLQFVVTTHSPIVISRMKDGEVRLFEDFRIVEGVKSVYGHDAGSVLTDVFDVRERAKEVEDRLDDVAKYIDAVNLEEARRALDSLRTSLGDTDRDVIRLGTMIEFMNS